MHVNIQSLGTKGCNAEEENYLGTNINLWYSTYIFFASIMPLTLAL